MFSESDFQSEVWWFEPVVCLMLGSLTRKITPDSLSPPRCINVLGP